MPMARHTLPSTGGTLALTMVLGACGGGSHGSSTARPSASQGTRASSSSPETNPAGDIPDNQVYVPRWR